jgi:hypothetical protein
VKLRSVLSIRVIVIIAGFALNLLARDTIKADAKISEMRFGENVFVADGSPYIETPHPAILNSLEVLLREGFGSIRYNSGNIKRTGMDSNWVRWRSDFLNRIGKGLWKRIWLDTHARHSCSIDCGGQAEIAGRQPNIWFYRWAEIVNELVVGGRNYANVGTQLPLLSILSYGDLSLRSISLSLSLSHRVGARDERFICDIGTRDRASPSYKTKQQCDARSYVLETPIPGAMRKTG